MYFLIGNWHMDRCDYERAIQNFERARTQMRYHESRTLFVISLVSLFAIVVITHQKTPFARYPGGSSTISTL